MLKIWGRTSSSNVKKVLWCADELELPFERIDAGGAFGIVDTAEFRALNPNGLVPTIDDDGVVLWESNVIVRYLYARYGQAKSPADRARAECWMDWTLGSFYPAYVPIFVALVRTSQAERDHDGLTASLARAGSLLEVVETALARQPFLSGRQLGVGDFALGAVIHAWYELPIERPNLLYLRAWYDRLLARPGYRRHVAVPIV